MGHRPASVRRGDRYAPMRLLDPVTNEWYPLPKEQRRVIDEQAIQLDEQATQLDEQAIQLDKQKAYIADLERRLGLGGANPSDSSDAERA